MTHGGLQSVRDALILARHQQYITDTEFILLFECNLSRPLFLYGKFEMFRLDCWDDEECKVELRFAKSDLALLNVYSEFPTRLHVSKELHVLELKAYVFFSNDLLTHADNLIWQSVLVETHQSYASYLMKFCSLVYDAHHHI